MQKREMLPFLSNFTVKNGCKLPGAKWFGFRVGQHPGWQLTTCRVDSNLLVYKSGM